MGKNGTDMNENTQLPQGWSSLKVFEGNSFNDLFNLDGIPLMWFYDRLFVPHVVPKQINTIEELKNNQKISYIKRKRLILTAKIVAKYIRYNESKKYIAFIKNEKKNSKNTTDNINNKENKKALFLSYLNHYEKDKIYRIQGIIDNLDKTKMEPYIIFADKLSSKTRDNLHNLNTLYQHIDQNSSQQAQKTAKEMYIQWNKMNKKELAKIISTNNQSMWPYLEPIFSLYMSEEFLYLTTLYYNTFKKIIREENISIAITTAQNGLFERCCLAAAKTEKIPAIFIQHGIGTISTNPNQFLNNTYLAVFGPYIKHKLIQAGMQSKKIITTGPIVYDEIINHIKKEKNNRASNTILIVTQPLVEDLLIEKEYYFKAIQKVIEICLSLNFQIDLKLHPREIHLPEYNKITSLNKEKIKIHQHKNTDQLYELLSQSRVMINFRSSTAILEASILNVPSITIPLVKNMPTYFKDLDPSIHLQFTDNLKNELQKVLEHPETNLKLRNKIITEFFGKIDGKSSKRAAQLILQLTNS